MEEMNHRKILADNIRNYRENNKVSRYKFSTILDLNNNTLTAIENEKANVRYDTLEKIVLCMGLSMSEIFTENYIKPLKRDL